MKSDVLIHIGHGGTGTSFLQRSFATTEFKSVLYGDNNGRMGLTLNVGIPTGNVSKHDDLHALVGSIESNGQPILFSSEFLFGRFGGNADDVAQLVSDGHRVRILQVIRDPLDHLLTSYGQGVKRGDELRPIEAFMKSYKSPRAALNRYEKLSGLGCDVTVLNYSRHTKNLKDVVGDWLGEPLATLDSPVVNRSLTGSEIRFILEAGKYLGADVKRIGNALCLRAKSVTPEKLRIEKNACEKFATRMKTMIERVNPSLPEAEKYQVPDDLTNYIQADPTPPLQLTEKQLAVALKGAFFQKK